jgi:hypothetical protein
MDEVFEIMGFPTTFLPRGNFTSHLRVAFFSHWKPGAGEDFAGSG